MKSKIIFFFLFVLAFYFNMQFELFAKNREKISINQVWKFKKGDIPFAEYPLLNDSEWSQVNIPHTWNNEDSFDDEPGMYMGVGWYRKVLPITDLWKDRKVYLFFEGANQIADIFINGHYVMQHRGGYTGFYVDCTPYLKFESGAQNILAVRLDNAVNEHIPPLSADFTFYGGIYRDVYLVAMDNLHFDTQDFGGAGVYWETNNVSEKSAQLKVYGKVVNEDAMPSKFYVESSVVAPNDSIVEVMQSFLKVEGKSTVNFNQLQDLKNIKLWSTSEPNMYSIRTKIMDAEKKTIDDVSIPLGFRYYKFTPDSGLYFNGKNVKLWGVNRHQDYPKLGNALPNEQHVKDMKLVKEMGANFIRISHYPQDPEVIKACDDLGLLASIEIPLVNRITESKQFTNNTLYMLQEMIQQNRNHPAVIIWTYMNEIYLSRPFGKDTTREKIYDKNLYNLTKSLDSTCLAMDKNRTTMAVFHGAYPLYHNKTKLTSIPMIVGWNLYMGWYQQEKKFIDFDDYIAMAHKESPNKSMIIAEYGAGADERIRTKNPRRYDHSIEYQNIYHDYYQNTIAKSPFVAGGALWAFLDFGSSGRKDVTPHINNKGIVNTYRQPKDAYWLYKSKIDVDSFVKIINFAKNTVSGIANPNEDKLIKKIVVYFNLKSVQFTVNNQIIGVKTIENGKAEFDVPLTSGTNKLEVSGIENQINIEDFQLLNVEIIPANLKNDKLKFKQIHINVGAHFDFTDTQGNVWLTDQEYTAGSWGYVGGKVFKSGWLVGTGKDIFGTDEDPLFQTQMDSIQAYKLDVPDGNYEITFCFAELLSSKEMETLLYNLGSDAQNKQKLTNRIFSISANGKTVLDKLNIAQQNGEQRAAIHTVIFTVTGGKGLELKFLPIQGNPILNGLKVRKI